MHKQTVWQLKYSSVHPCKSWGYVLSTLSFKWQPWISCVDYTHCLQAKISSRFLRTGKFKEIFKRNYTENIIENTKDIGKTFKHSRWRRLLRKSRYLLKTLETLEELSNLFSGRTFLGKQIFVAYGITNSGHPVNGVYIWERTILVLLGTFSLQLN